MERGSHPSKILPYERTIDGTLGVEYVHELDDDGIARARMPVSERVLQPYGFVHGGAIMTLAESLVSRATGLAVAPEGKLAMGQEIGASLLRPITQGHVNGIARLRKRGRSTWVWEVEITNDEGALCALVRATIAVRELGDRRLPAEDRMQG